MANTVFDPTLANRDANLLKRGQLNVDIGLSRRTRLRVYCHSKGLSIVDCIKQMIDFCIGGGEEEDNA